MCSGYATGPLKSLHLAIEAKTHQTNNIDTNNTFADVFVYC